MPPLDAPLVSVGVPVRNGAAWLAETLGDLLSQTVEDLEVVVSDNASTDGTGELVREIADRDPRVRYCPVDVDRGPGANYNRVAELSRGRWFAWSAADDRHAPTFLERCLAALEADDTAVLAHTRTLVLAEDGSTRPLSEAEPAFEQPTPSARLAEHLRLDRRRDTGYTIFGLIRRGALEQVLPQGSYASADRVLLGRLLLRGRFLRLPEPLFLSRDHPGRSMRTAAVRGHHGRSRVADALGGGPLPGSDWWDPARRGQLHFPEWNEVGEYLRAVRDADLPPDEARRCRVAVARFAALNGHKLARDVAIGGEHWLRRAAAARRGDVRPPSAPAPS